VSRKTADNTVKHRNGGVGSVVANHRSGGESSVVVTTLLNISIFQSCLRYINALRKFCLKWTKPHVPSSDQF